MKRRGSALFCLTHKFTHTGNWKYAETKFWDDARNLEMNEYEFVVLAYWIDFGSCLHKFFAHRLLVVFTGLAAPKIRLRVLSANYISKYPESFLSTHFQDGLQFPPRLSQNKIIWSFSLNTTRKKKNARWNKERIRKPLTGLIWTWFSYSW